MSVINMSTAVAEVARWIADGVRHYVCVTGVHGVMESQGDADLLEIHNRSGLTTPDGMPMVWSGRRAGAHDMQRVYGPDLMLELCREAVLHGWKFYFYGGGDGIADTLSARLQQQFPGLRVVGCHTPPFRPLTSAEDASVVSDINFSGADIVWVGLSTPKQELWMSEHRQRLDAAALIGVGAAFDIRAGLVPQAPPWMQRRGLEWFYRLVREPRRLWKRYLINNPKFVVAIMRRPPRLIPAPLGTTAVQEDI